MIGLKAGLSATRALLFCSSVKLIIQKMTTQSYNYMDELNSNRNVTEADKKFVETIIAKHIDPSSDKISNPSSGWVGPCTPLVAALSVFVYALSFTEFSPEMLAKYGVPDGRKIQMFDRARMLILKLNKDVYSNVID